MFLIILPIALSLINFSIAWEGMFEYWPEALRIPVPNPIDPSGFLGDLFVTRAGAYLDDYFGLNIFYYTFDWILGGIFYIPLYGSLIIFFYKLLLADAVWWLQFLLIVLWVAFLTYFYYFNALDKYEIFYFFSMPHNASRNIHSYYWVGIVGSCLLLFFNKRHF